MWPTTYMYVCICSSLNFYRATLRYSDHAGIVPKRLNCFLAHSKFGYLQNTGTLRNLLPNSKLTQFFCSFAIHARQVDSRMWCQRCSIVAKFIRPSSLLLFITRWMWRRALCSSSAAAVRLVFGWIESINHRSRYEVLPVSYTHLTLPTILRV